MKLGYLYGGKVKGNLNLGVDPYSGEPSTIHPISGLGQVLFLEQATIVELEFPVFTAPCKCKVLEIGITPDDEGITGADTDSMTLQFQNKGADGTGTDVMAEKAFVAGVDVAAFDYDNFGAVSYADLEKDDVISLQKINVGNGLGSPDLIVTILFLEVP